MPWVGAVSSVAVKSLLARLAGLASLRMTLPDLLALPGTSLLSSLVTKMLPGVTVTFSVAWSGAVLAPWLVLVPTVLCSVLAPWVVGAVKLNV